MCQYKFAFLSPIQFKFPTSINFQLGHRGINSHNNGTMVTSLVFFFPLPSLDVIIFLNIRTIGHHSNSISAMRPCVFRLVQLFLLFLQDIYYYYFIATQKITTKFYI